MNRLKEARRAKRLTQAEVARQLGISQNGYSNWETGARAIDAPSLSALAALFGVSADYLLGLDSTEYADGIGFDDFTYAMYDAARELTPENKEKLLEMARFFKQQQEKQD
ncbi:MAG: XRE family transcriptional regulator [Clostridia bacterium]|nr:XRE family transcriptional regulator [Clostridia bacterium]